MGGLLGWLFYAAGRSLWIAQFLVMPDGKLPLKNYSLQSIANLSDKGLIVLAIAPLTLLLLVLVWRRLQAMTDRIFAATIIVATIAGRVTQIALDPVNGIVLDFPRLTAYLAPLAIALAFFVDRRTSELVISRRTAMFALALSVMIPLLSAPGYTKIDDIEPLAKTFAENNDHYYRTTGLAFRDAYFYTKNLDKANSWEWSLPIKSPDFLNMRGCFDLVANGQHSDALVSLHRLVARQPYWAEPRALLVIVQLKLGRMEAAKAHLDTCLILEPHGKSHWINRYRYFQAVRRFDSAYVAVGEARNLFFSDKDIATEAMVIAFQAGALSDADSLASGFLTADSTTSYAHLIKARLADQKGLRDSAIAEYRRFTRTAPKGNPDVDMALQRLTEMQEE
jgi:tetratricopeptide (TPR) repeat protein